MLQFIGFSYLIGVCLLGMFQIAIGQFMLMIREMAINSRQGKGGGQYHVTSYIATLFIIGGILEIVFGLYVTIQVLSHIK